MFNNKDIQSDEELYSSWFFEELRDRGYVDNIIYQPKPFTLSQAITYNWEKPKPTKKEPDRKEYKESTLLEGAIYTADLEVHWNEKAKGIFFDVRYPDAKGNGKFIGYLDSMNAPYKSYIEVKPVFDDNNMTREVILKHKWVYQKYGIYVNMFIRDKVMPKLFTPQKYILNQVYKKTTVTKQKGKLEAVVKRPGDSKIRWEVRTLD